MSARKLLLGIAIAGVSVVAALVLWVSAQTNDHTSEQLPASAPLAELLVFRERGETDEVFVKLDTGVRVADVLDVSILHDLSFGMRNEGVTKVLGQPAGIWTDPIWGNESPYWVTRLGRVSIGRPSQSNGGLAWATMAYPNRNEMDRVLRDPRLQSQLLPLLAKRSVGIHFRQADGLQLTLWATRQACQGLHLLTGAL